MKENPETRCEEKELERWSASEEAARIAEALHSDALVFPGEQTIADKVVASRGSAPDPVIELKARLRRWRWATALASAACLALAATTLNQAGQGPQSGSSVEKSKPAGVGGVGEMRSRLSETREKLTVLSTRPKFWNARKPGDS